jgi:hypothetical protein
VHVRLKRDRRRVSRSRVYRLCAKEQLQLRSKLSKARPSLPGGTAYGTGLMNEE